MAENMTALKGFVVALAEADCQGLPGGTAVSNSGNDRDWDRLVREFGPVH
jgi:hypothetical protein